MEAVDRTAMVTGAGTGKNHVGTGALTRPAVAPFATAAPTTHIDGAAGVLARRHQCMTDTRCPASRPFPGR
jgi:hypothetical protein